MADETGTRESRSKGRGSRRRRRSSSAPNENQDQQVRSRSSEGDSEDGGARRRRRRRRRPAGDDAQPRSERSERSESSRDDEGGRSGSRKRRRRSGGGGGGESDGGSRQRSSKSRRRRGGGGGGGGGGGRRRGGGDNSPDNLLPERDPFVELVSIDPEERFELEIEPDDIEMRVLDILTPIGKGQRGLIVAPPKTGKTTLLLQMAKAVAENHPEVELIIMLVDERPEEVTAFKRAGYGRVMASSNDEPTRNHLKLTQKVLNVAKDMVLDGKDVCILLDSITRMARAHNVGQRGSHRTLSGGLDARALEKPKRFFGAARKVLDGGSLTIIGTALIDTGSRQDEVIFQEFKGTGNMELQLDRRLAERRVWPAIDIARSGTRKEEKLFPKDEYEGVVAIRRALGSMHPVDAMQMLVTNLKKFKTNREFLLDCAERARGALEV